MSIDWKKECWKDTTTCFSNPYTIPAMCYIIHASAHCSHIYKWALIILPDHVLSLFALRDASIENTLINCVNHVTFFRSYVTLSGITLINFEIHK